LIRARGLDLWYNLLSSAWTTFRVHPSRPAEGGNGARLHHAHINHAAQGPSSRFGCNTFELIAVITALFFVLALAQGQIGRQIAGQRSFVT